MYPYHNMIKKRIKEDELIGYEYAADYKNIGKCLLLYFNTPPFKRSVRPHKYHEYILIYSQIGKRIRRRKKRMI